VVARGTRPRERNPYSYCHFTVLGFTADNGAPVMCAVIVAVNQFTPLEESGINYRSEDFLTPGTLEEKATKYEYKNGCNRLFPMG
jgi:hypothetical protein